MQDIWHDDPADVTELNGHLRGEIEAELDRMVDDPAHVPLGRFFIGGAGSGKTHLLSAVRRQAAERRAGFILVDMTDVRDFWDVVLQGFLDSLQTPYADGKFQHEVLLHQFIGQFARDKAAKNLELLAKRKTKALANDVKLIIGVLRQRWPREALSFRDTIRALICLNSQDYEIAAGLSAIRDRTRRSLILITGVENTYRQLAESVSRAYLDRYETQTLARQLPADVFGGLIRGRLAPAYTGLGFSSPYPTWPFHPDAIAGLASESPREPQPLADRFGEIDAPILNTFFVGYRIT